MPKAFSGLTGVIQRNALRSWTRLAPGWEVLVFGDDPGTAEACREFGLRHIPQVARNAVGTPLLDDLFRRAEAAASHDLLAYVNADIILVADFAAAVYAVRAQLVRFLLVGRRWNLDVAEEIDFSPGWEGRLRRRVTAEGRLQPAWWIDYLVFPRGLFGSIPPFAIGRTSYDNWLIYRARTLHVPVIDASDAILAIHQNHDYGHVPGGQDVWKGPESLRNRGLAGGEENLFTIDDATHLLRDGRLRRACGRSHLRRKLEGAAVLHPRWRGVFRFLLALLDSSHRIRSRLGLAANPPPRRP